MVVRHHMFVIAIIIVDQTFGRFHLVALIQSPEVIPVKLNALQDTLVKLTAFINWYLRFFIFIFNSETKLRVVILLHLVILDESFVFFRIPDV